MRGDAQQRQSTYHMLSAAGDVESAAQKHRDETFVFESSGESSQPLQQHIQNRNRSTWLTC